MAADGKKSGDPDHGAWGRESGPAEAGAPEPDGVPAEDALFVLTAAMLTPARYPGVLGDDYPEACAGLGLEPLAFGYGLVFGQDGSGARWTVATTDTAAVACALAAWDCGLAYALAPDEESVAASLPGWPLPVAVAAPGVPDPHDPAAGADPRPALSPPDAGRWGPAQRRLGADEIAVRWREWQERLGQEAAAREAAAQEARARKAGSGGDAAARSAAVSRPADDESSAALEGDAAEPPPTGRPGDAGPAAAARRSPAPPLSHSGVRSALSAAEGYLRDAPPPGRVRTVNGALRADGPGWSLVARADGTEGNDGVAFVLLDEAPGEVLPVGRGPALPALLDGLGALVEAPPRPAAAVTPS